MKEKKNIINKIFELNMGAYNSREMIESSYYNFPYNNDLKLSAWEGHCAKNYGYYSGERFCKISRKYYPASFTRGYIWGYWYNPEPIEELQEEEKEEEERSF